MLDLEPSAILGILWEENADSFIFNFKDICKFTIRELATTKGNVWKSELCYNTIGVLQSLIISFKLLFKKVCKEKNGWYEEI